MYSKEDKRVLALVVLSMLAFAVTLGLICKFYVIPAYAAETETSELTSYEISTEFTSEQQETLDSILNGDVPELNTPENVDRVLDATGAWLEVNTPQNRSGDPEESSEEEVATDTDADWDPSPYLTYPLDQRWIDDTDTVQKGLDDIYRMVLSIRNILILFMGGCFIIWVHKVVKGVVYRLNGRGLK